MNVQVFRYSVSPQGVFGPVAIPGKWVSPRMHSVDLLDQQILLTDDFIPAQAAEAVATLRQCTADLHAVKPLAAIVRHLPARDHPSFAAEELQGIGAGGHLLQPGVEASSGEGVGIEAKGTSSSVSPGPPPSTGIGFLCLDADAEDHRLDPQQNPLTGMVVHLIVFFYRLKNHIVRVFLLIDLSPPFRRTWRVLSCFQKNAVRPKPRCSILRLDPLMHTTDEFLRCAVFLYRASCCHCTISVSLFTVLLPVSSDS